MLFNALLLRFIAFEFVGFVLGFRVVFGLSLVFADCCWFGVWIDDRFLVCALEALAFWIGLERVICVIY